MKIEVNVKPNAQEDYIRKVSDREYEIDVSEPAEDNKANNKVIKLLSRESGVSFKQIKIKSPRSRKKIVEILNSGA